MSITPAVGPVTLLVFAQPATPATPSSGGPTPVASGLFGINLTANGAGSATFETTQGVGQLFSARKVTVATGGTYQVVVGDVGFPANFGSLAVMVTRGTSQIGSIFGGGSFTFPATGGDYLVNFVAQPTGADEAGTYAMTVGLAPPAPTVTLQSSATSVASGSTVTLTWSSQNATVCTATSTSSGGWSGAIAVSGTATSAALTAATTFTLSCTGPGSSTPQTQSVTVNISSTSGGGSSGGGGGGGAIRPDLLALLFGLILLRAIGRRGVRVTRLPRVPPNVGPLADTDMLRGIHPC
jgi:hypothetical protein